MLSDHFPDYLTFLSKYFNIPPATILQKSIDLNIISQDDSSDLIVNKLKSTLGFQRRLLEPLSIAFKKTTPFDSLVYLYAFKIFDKHCSFLIADEYNIFRLIYFKRDNSENFSFNVGDILKIDSCYPKDGKLLTNQIPKHIWFYDFSHIFTINDYYLDNLPDCIYDEEYTKKTNLVTIIGYFLSKSKNDKLFCYIYTKELQIRIIPYKIDEIDSSFNNKLVKISYCELDYGPDAYQLKMSEFSEFTILSSIPLSSDFSSLLRFEYPSFKMSLSELTDKSVAITRVSFLTVDRNDTSWKFYGYDSSQAFCLTVFDTIVAEQLSSIISQNNLLLVDGLFRHGKNLYMRERLANIESLDLDEEDNLTVPISNPNHISEEKFVILDCYVSEILEKFFITKQNKQDSYEKIKAVSYNSSITINNYNKDYFQKFLVGKSYRFFFLRSKFFNNNLYFIMDSTTVIQIIP
jgi:hypothetical protein